MRLTPDVLKIDAGPMLQGIENPEREEVSAMEDIFVRNRGWIPQWLQEKIRRVRVLIVGCGLGALIALRAARTGFRRFWLCDGDCVEIHNLNRQPFVWAHIGQNKADVTGGLIMAINPEAEVNVWPRFLRDQEEIDAAIEWADIVVNMSDPERSMYVISERARVKGIPEIHPLNIGWMGYCLVLTPETPALSEIVGGEIYGPGFYPALITATLGKIPLPPEEIDLEKIACGEMAFPQLGPTSSATAALVVTAIARLVAGDASLPLAPQPIVFELWGTRR